MTALVAGIEAGGTKFVCALGTGPDDIRSRCRIDTTTPKETLGKVVEFLHEQQSKVGSPEAVGVGSFGPLDPNPASPGFGHITETPKPNWSNTDLVGPIREALGVPVGFDTDVNAAALGEWRWGAAQGLDVCLYLTVGTGIGGGGVINGQLMHGLVHPEMGHVRLPRDPARDPFAGCCPFHGDCLEGLASGPALAARWGVPAEELPADHEAWDLQAEYLALAINNFICTLSPQRVILGGGVMAKPELLPSIRVKTAALLNDYVRSPAILEHLDQYIVPPGLGVNAGVLGSMALGLKQLEAGEG